MITRTSRLSKVVCSAAMSALLPALASAQTQTGSEGIEEIIVTAQKRAQALTDVGATVNVLQGAALRDLNIASTADLTKVVPALSVQPANLGITGAPVYTLRGVGFAEHSLSALGAVSVYTDEVPLPYPYMTAGPLFDVERVEVLKGPQGTLYGQNSTGGLINYVVRKPTEDFSAGVIASYGRFNQADLEGYVSAPLGGSFALRAAARVINGDGWQVSRTRPGDHLGSTDKIAGRLLLVGEPTPELRMQLGVSGWRDRSESVAPQIIGVNPTLGNAVFTDAVYPFASTLIDAIERDDDDVRKADWTPNRRYKNDNDMIQGWARLDYSFSDELTLTSLSSVARLHNDAFHDMDGVAENISNNDAHGKIETFNQELRLAGDGDRLHWIVGGNYSHDDISAENPSDPRGVSIATLSGATLTQLTVSDSTRKSYAFFANADYDMTPELTLTGGVRYTNVKLDYLGCNKDGGDGSFAALLGGAAGAGECVTFHILTPPVGTPGLIPVSIDEDNVSWRAGINYKPQADTLIYGLISRGYKSGNIPTLAASSDLQLQPVKQEEVTAYEIGIKGQLMSTLRFEAAVFHYDYKDKQLYAYADLPPIGIGETTINIPKSRVNGAELTLHWQPVSSFTFNGGVGYTDSRIGNDTPLQFGIDTSTTFPPAAGFSPIGLVDVSGDAFNLAPKWQANSDAEYRQPIGNSLEAFVGASVVYASSTLPTIGASDALRMDSYTLFGARLGIRDQAGRWRAYVWGENITDERYTVAVIRQFDTTNRFNGMPATYGLTVAYDF